MSIPIIQMQVLSDLPIAITSQRRAEPASEFVCVTPESLLLTTALNQRKRASSKK